MDRCGRWKGEGILLWVCFQWWSGSLARGVGCSIIGVGLEKCEAEQRRRCGGE